MSQAPRAESPLGKPQLPAKCLAINRYAMNIFQKDERMWAFFVERMGDNSPHVAGGLLSGASPAAPEAPRVSSTEGGPGLLSSAWAAGGSTGPGHLGPREPWPGKLEDQRGGGSRAPLNSAPDTQAVREPLPGRFTHILLPSPSLGWVAERCTDGHFQAAHSLRGDAP